MAGLVHEIAFVSLLFYQTSHGSLQDPQGDQAFRQCSDCCVVGFIPVIPRPHRINGGKLRGQNDLVHGALAAVETAVDGESAGNIARVTFIFCAGVNQQDIPVLHFPRVVDVMQDATVCPATHDAGISCAERALAHEFMEKFSFNLVFHHSRPACLHCAHVGVCGNRCGLAQPVDLLPAFIQAHVMQDVVQGYELFRCVNPGAGLAAHMVYPAQHALVERGVISHGVINPLPVLQ